MPRVWSHIPRIFPGRPNEVTTPEMTNKIHNIVLNEPKVNVCEILEIISISTERVDNIFYTHLCMRKICARWVSSLLTIDRKRIRVTTSEQNFSYFNPNSKEFLRRFVTMNETWVHQNSPESHNGSKQSVKPGKSALKRLETQQSIGCRNGYI